MKNFTFLFTLLILSLGFAFQANATSGCDCDGNKLTNGSFESGLTGWTKSYGTFSTSTGYDVCGEKNGLLGDKNDNAAKIYQDVNVTPGNEVTLTVYAGTHKNQYDHTITLVFLNSSGQQVGDKVVQQVDYEVGNGSSLQKYTLTGTAPANTVKVRVQAYAQKNYLKIDGACLKVKVPVACDCVDSNKYIKNASFENGTADWQYAAGTSGATFSKDGAYEMCGSSNGLLYKKGKIWQDISMVPGTQIQLSAYGGTHVNNSSNRHYFKITFYDGAGTLLGDSSRVLMDYIVTDNQLKKFDLSATAPAGAVKARFTVESTGDYFKVDAICTTVTPPVTCQECNGNTLKNPSFESGTDNWSVTGSLSVESIYAVCGVNGAKLSGAGKFWQDVELFTTTGNQVSLTIYAAYGSSNSQKIQLVFLNEALTELGQITQDVTKALNSGTWGLQKYTLGGTVPSGSKYVRVLLSSNGNDLLVDNACLTFSGPPLPVTLSSFSAKKEGALAQLAWATTSESNSAYFEVQHSQDGQNWTALAQVDAKGESKELETYTYTHTNPLAVNLYRLKMVDLDETFAYSAIKSLKFDGQEQLNVYPNPTVDRIKVTSNQLVTNVKVYAQTGALVLNATPDSSNEVDLTKLSQGTYYVKINNGPLMRKILVVR
ncbi:Por secretion system C-terminal sorting domain-containing protein [Dyadobacter soli]|uniref:Por secretion system C-terminal sorting domain-containing protein n=1 Tax=Dyadobacter soli TaxID=659014 RepID=A0A1G7HKB9_9BACT|nr:T9SS type A sorting domain-containing protein [Dyadobacter soli]SDF00937.1 Por secretion system C-terminal sorting domain-containing protein [Dyadobacter soli]